MKKETLERQESILQLDCFTNEDATRLGMLMREKAIKKGYDLVISISKCNQLVFHTATENARYDFECWAKRKLNSVYRFHSSTYRLQLRLAAENKTLKELFKLEEADYGTTSGGFPIRVRRVGFVGAVAVSGLTGSLDHSFVVDCLGEFLALPPMQFKELEKENENK